MNMRFAGIPYASAYDFHVQGNTECISNCRTASKDEERRPTRIMADNPVCTGERIEKDGHRATVRYVGEIRSPKLPAGQLWVGVEWDEEGRGKHDGSFEGTAYFSCPPGKGSFLKMGTFERGVTFLQALRNRYEGGGLDNADEDDVIRDEDVNMDDPKSFQIELVGMRKVHHQQAQLTALNEAGISGCRISCAGKPEEITNACSNITNLDLSANLLQSWTEVMLIASALPKLSTLVLAGNRMRSFGFANVEERGLEDALKGLRVLVLNDTGVTTDDLLRLLPLLPALEELHIGGNGLKEIAPMAPFLSSLVALNMASNAIDSWEDVRQCCAQASSLKRLVLNDNAIDVISAAEDGHPFVQLEGLSVSGTNIAGWESVNALLSFPQLADLRFQNCPLSSTISRIVFRQFVIARVPTLQSLNGGAIRPKERADSEKLYLKDVAMKASSNGTEVDYTLHPRYKALVAEHGEPLLSRPGTTSSQPTSNVVSVQLRCNAASSCTSDPITKRVPATITLQRLKLICQQLFKVSADQQKLYLVQGTPVPELMDDDRQDLLFYGIIGDGAEILIEEIDEDAERREQERLRQDHEKRLQQQEREATSMLQIRQGEVSDTQKGIISSAAMDTV